MNEEWRHKKQEPRIKTDKRLLALGWGLLGYGQKELRIMIYGLRVTVFKFLV